MGEFDLWLASMSKFIFKRIWEDQKENHLFSLDKLIESLILIRVGINLCFWKKEKGDSVPYAIVRYQNFLKYLEYASKDGQLNRYTLSVFKELFEADEELQIKQFREFHKKTMEEINSYTGKK